MSLLLSWAVSASLILGAVLVLRLALGRFLSPRGRLLLWALAGARLALPVTFPSPLGDLWTRMAPLASPSAAVPSPSALAQALPASPGAAAVGETAAASASFPLWAVVWGMGAAVLAGWFLAAGILLARRSRRLPCGDEDTLSLAQRWAPALGRSSPPPVRTGGRRPYTAGILRPVVVLPDALPPCHREQALLHELCHWKNRDTLATAIALALLCLHWYNPLAWGAFFALRADLELRCDSQVVALTGRRQDYAHLLLDCARGGWFPSGAVQNGGWGLGQRLRALGRSRPALRVVLPVTLLAAVVLAILLGDMVSRPAETGAAPSQTSFTAYDAWTEVLGSSFTLRDGQFLFAVPDTLPGEDLSLSLEGEWVAGDSRQTFLTAASVPAGTSYAFPLPDPLPEGLSLSATLTDSRGGLVFSCSFLPSLEALALQMPPYGDGSFDPDDWVRQVGDSIRVDGDFLRIGLPVLPEGWTPQVLIAGRVAMGEDDAMSWHDDDPSVQPGMIYFRDLPEGILDLTVTYTLFSPTGEAAGEGSWEWSDQTV